MFRDVTPLVRPRSVAVVGASSRRVSQGNLVITNLKEWRFPGPVIPVHPSAASIDGLPAVSSPEALPEGTDLAVVAIPAAGVGEALNGLEVDGRVLNINEARPKEDRYSGGGGYNNNRNRNRNSW